MGQLLENKKLEMFDPIKLIGEKIFFQCSDKKIHPKILEIISIKKHYECTTIHKGRCDLVFYETNFGEFPMEFSDINNLIENGISKGEFINYEFKIIKNYECK